MPILNEKLLGSLSNRLRYQLERINIGGISEWDPIFSNAYGMGNGNTLVILMRPLGPDKPDIADDAQKSEELKTLIGDIIKQNKLNVSDLSFHKWNTGFLAAVSLNEA
jgi:hypothetical protein